MSTRSGIGYKTKAGNVYGVFCHYDGYIGGVGMLLHTFYKDAENVKTLIKMGDIDSLGSVPYFPTGLHGTYNELCDFCSINKDCKETNYTLSYKAQESFLNRFTNEDYETKSFKNDKEYYNNTDGEYIYLFDEGNNEWYVIEKVNNTLQYFRLSELINSKAELKNFFLAKYSAWNEDRRNERANDSVKEEMDAILNYKQRLEAIRKTSRLELINHWLVSKNLSNKVKIAESETKEMGKGYSVYVPNGSKSKAVLRSTNLNDLTLAICKQFKISPFERPYFYSK